MKLEDQVVSLDIAKRLKSLGVEQDGIFHYTQYPDSKWGLFHGMFSNPKDEYSISAFTTGEIGEMLPKGSEMPQKIHIGWIYSVPLVNNVEPKLDPTIEDTEANARGKMLIYLIEHNLKH